MAKSENTSIPMTDYLSDIEEHPAVIRHNHRMPDDVTVLIF